MNSIIIRTAGNGIYRNSKIKKATKYIPQDGSSLRPETTTMEGMIAPGHLMYRTNIVVGMHDLEQFFADIFFADIYRKTFLYAKKHSNVLEEMLSYWEQMKQHDEDFKIALMGAETGKDFQGTIKIDKRFQQKEWQRICSHNNIKEKEPLSPSEVTPACIKDYVTAFEADITLQKKS